jgi:hypothetical protein
MYMGMFDDNNAERAPYGTEEIFKLQVAIQILPPRGLA